MVPLVDYSCLSREQLIQRLRAQEQISVSYHLLMEQAPDGIFIADTEGNYVDVNQAGTAILGYTREEILALNIADINLLPATELRRLMDSVGWAGILPQALAALGAFLRTEPGLALRATGMNPTGSRAQGVDQRVAVAVALGLANGLAALGGALTAQNQGFAEINMGVGTLIAGAGALLLGELLLRPTAATVGRRRRRRLLILLAWPSTAAATSTSPIATTIASAKWTQPASLPRWRERVRMVTAATVDQQHRQDLP